MDDAQPRTATLPGIDGAAEKQRRLTKKKGIALAVLVGACVCFVILTALDQRYPSAFVGLLAAMSEAAMVGGLADWFAVTALFRHPMGQRWIPHTAIIPRSKNKIGTSLADFICENFLGKDQVLAKIREFNPADRLAKSMSTPESAKKIADFVVKFSPRLVDMMDSVELQEFVRAATKEKLRGVDVSSLLAQLLTTLTKDGRHQEVIDSLLTDVADLANNPATRSMLAEKIASELWAAVRWVNLDKPIAKNIAEKVAMGFRKLLREVADNKNHELRLRFDGKIPEFIDRLRSDNMLRARVEQFRDRALGNQELSVYIQDVWTSMIDWLRQDLARTDSSIRNAALNAALNIGEKLSANTEMKEWFNGWVMDTAAPMVEEYRGKIRLFMIDRVAAWSADELTKQLELSMGSDLQSIRLSGTLVGAMIGGLLFGLMHLVKFLAS